jgi:hypothetical protein
MYIVKNVMCNERLIEGPDEQACDVKCWSMLRSFPVR